MMLSRGVRAAARSCVRKTTRQPRRYNSHSTGHEETASHVAGGSGNEPMGKGFYIALTIIPLSMVVYSVATSSDKPLLTRVIDDYRTREEEIVRRNELHAAAVEQAAADKLLFRTEGRVPLAVLRFPEKFNQASPWNVVAGGGGADLGQLMEHYVKQEQQMEEERLARIKDGRVVTIYDDTTGGRIPSWVPFIGKK